MSNSFINININKKKVDLNYSIYFLVFHLYKYLLKIKTLLFICRYLTSINIFKVLGNVLAIIFQKINYFLYKELSNILIDFNQNKFVTFLQNYKFIFNRSNNFVLNLLWNDRLFSHLYYFNKLIIPTLNIINIKFKYLLNIYIQFLLKKSKFNLILNFSQYKLIFNSVYYNNLNLKILNLFMLDKFNSLTIKHIYNLFYQLQNFKKLISSFFFFVLNLIHYNSNINFNQFKLNFSIYSHSYLTNLNYIKYLLLLFINSTNTFLDKQYLENIKSILSLEKFFFNTNSIFLNKKEISNLNQDATFIKNKLNYILLQRYFNYIYKYNLDKNKFILNFYRNNTSRDIYVKKLKNVKDTIKIFKNSIYSKKYYPFISFKFFKQYLDIVFIWFFNNMYSAKFNLIYRNIFIVYIKHLNFSFFNKYLNWINKSKKFVITLNVNIGKNNLFYTLINKQGQTIANLSVGLFYLLPRNKNLKKNPFKKSVSYLTYEMFSMIFFNKFIFPLKFYKKDRRFEYFKIPLKNTNNLLFEWRTKNKNLKLYRKKYRVYFLFKFLRQKYFFPGLSKNILSFIGKKKTSWRKLYQFIGVYKMYPRVHNGCRKKKKRRL